VSEHLKARKGIATKTLFELGMFVLAFIVIAAFATPAIQGSAENILRWLSGKGGESDLEFETTTLTEAIKCAYYRCKEDCSEAIAKTNPDYFVCEDYCKEEWQDEDGKICDDIAKVHPVELFFTGKKTIEDKFWDELTGRAQNSLHKSDCVVGRSYSRSNDNLIFPKDSECSVRSAGRDGVIYDNCELSTQADKLFLWSENHNWPNSCTFGVTCTSTIMCEEFKWEVEIVPEELTEIDIDLVASMSYSDMYKIVVESDSEIIDEAFLKVEGMDTNHCPDFKDHPLVTFTCDEAEYSSEQICVDETLRCGKFSLTFEKYKKPEGTPAKFDIIYTDTPPTETPSEEEPTPPIKTCCSYYGSWYCVTSSDCASIGGIVWSVSCDTAAECEGL